jgi:hypothetical protein
MPTEAGRHQLYEKIKEQWGDDHANELMSYLPPVGWADVATKQDIAHLRTDLDTQTALLRAEMATQGAELRADMTAGFEALRAEMHKGFTDQHRAFDVQLRWMLGIVLTAFVGLTGVFAAIVNWLLR